jgi:hypothetical protein
MGFSFQVFVPQAEWPALDKVALSRLQKQCERQNQHNQPDFS